MPLPAWTHHRLAPPHRPLADRPGLSQSHQGPPLPRKEALLGPHGFAPATSSVCIPSHPFLPDNCLQAQHKCRLLHEPGRDPPWHSRCQSRCFTPPHPTPGPSPEAPEPQGCSPEPRFASTLLCPVQGLASSLWVETNIC